MINPYNYTSSNVKLLKHLDKLRSLQNNKPVSPVMVHLSLTSKCNLNCSYCCYGNRNKTEELSLEELLSVIDSFSSIGTRGLELTGSGEPTLHPYINEVIRYGYEKGMSIGLITNGTNVDKVTEWDKISWVRVSPHVLIQNKPYLENKMRRGIKKLKTFKNLDLGSVFIISDNYEEGFKKFINFINEYELPSRVTPDLTKPTSWIQENMTKVKNLMLTESYKSSYAFVSDFNIKYTRNIDTCWMRYVKPFVHSDGFVYECPGSSFNGKNVEEQFRVCNIKDIKEYYLSPITKRDFGCSFCKYSCQNDLINDLLVVTKHNDFA